MGTRWTLATLAVAALLALGGCSDGESSVEPSPTAPLLLPSCAGGERPRTCLTDIAALVEREARLRATGERVTRHDVLEVVEGIVENLSEYGALNAYHLNTPLGDADVEEASTAPIKTTWDFGDATGSLWACFSKGSVRVQLSACS